MKRFLIFLLCATLILSVTACGKAKLNETESTTETTKIASESSAQTDENTTDLHEEEENMKLYINNNEIPVIWEENESVAELMEETAKGDIVIAMSMYSDFEQVGLLGKQYSSDDKQTTTHCGDIVLYNSSNLVVFYGSNSWAYTRLGKMDLSENEITDLLSNGDVTITIKK